MSVNEEEEDYIQDDDEEEHDIAFSSKSAKKKIKKESSSSSSSSDATSQQKKKFAVGSLLAVNLFGDDNYFEAVLKGYNKSANSKDKSVLWCHMHYLHDNKTLQNDLNLLKVIDLSKEKIINYNDDKKKVNDDDDETGFLGRRIIVQWPDGKRYTGLIIKYMQNKKNFAFIKYDDGEECWYNLSPSKEKGARNEEIFSNSSGSGNKNSNSSTKKVKKEIAADTCATERKYPPGTHISVAIYLDEHYYDCVVKKYLKTSKAQIEKNQKWAYVDWCLSKTSSNKKGDCIDLNFIKAIKIKPERIITLDEIDGLEEDVIGFLGRRMEVQWNDGNEYVGIVTKAMKNNKYFVFLEYDDGDKCWCDLRQESGWSIVDDPKRKASATIGESSKKKAIATYDSDE
jgi:hypothetical protein